MIIAIQAMYTCTKNELKVEVINATVGKCQGATPTICLLFIIYMDVMVRMIR